MGQQQGSRIEFGDCRETMRRWAAEGVKAQMCVTSPPYYGLRNYGHDGQIGLEQTPEQYIAAMVEVFRCVWDVLADDGVLWLNIGDSYAGAGYSNNKNTGGAARVDGGKQRHLSGTGRKNKDLIGIPWMLAFALRADGWYLRQEIIWHKPNPMPESVRDRCTKAHEQIFLLAKQPRYYFDNEAIKTPVKQDRGTRDRQDGKYHNEGTGLQPHSGLEKSYEMANKRSVWSVNTRPYKGAHFATFPPELIEPCILAGSMPVGAFDVDDLIYSPAGSGDRDEDLSKIVGRAGFSRERRMHEATRPMSRGEQAAYAAQLKISPYRAEMESQAGGRSTFAHYLRTDRNGARAIPPALLDNWIRRGWLNPVEIAPRLAEPHRSIILDPFMGSGTTAGVALKHGRQYLGCELNPDYGSLQAERIASLAAPQVKNLDSHQIEKPAANDPQINQHALF